MGPFNNGCITFEDLIARLARVRFVRLPFQFELRRDFQRMTLHGWRVESQVGDVTTNCRVTNGREVSSAGEKG